MIGITYTHNELWCFDDNHMIHRKIAVFRQKTITVKSLVAALLCFTRVNVVMD